VDVFLDAFMNMGAPPMARATDSGDNGDFTSGEIAEGTTVVDPLSEHFSAFCFKLQANLDPKHRDRLALFRICSGTFERGMKHARLKGKEMALTQVQTLMGNDRVAVDDACFPGDVIGVANPAATFAIGDTIYTGPQRIAYTKIPSFSPEVFAECFNPSPSKYKAFAKGMDQLLAEGAVQRLRQRGSDGPGANPTLAAVGPLQFEVVVSRLESEYGVEVKLERLPYHSARWALAGWDAVDAAQREGQLLGVLKLEDEYGRPVLLFPSEYKLTNVLNEAGAALQLRPYAVAPDFEERRRR